MALRPIFESPNPTARKAGKLRLTRTQSVVGNTVMFVVTAVVCYLIVAGFKGAGSPDHASAYTLVTKRQIEAGEVLSPENAAWRPVTGRAPAGVVIGKSAKEPISDYVAVSRINEGKPVRTGLVTRQTVATVQTEGGLSGYILNGPDVAWILPFIKPGDRIDINAIAAPDNAKMAQGVRPVVSAVMIGAEVTGVNHGSGSSRSGTPASLVIGVTPEQARLLAAVRRFATLEVVLSPKRAAVPGPPQAVWESLDQLGMGAVADQDRVLAPEESAAVAAPAEPARGPIQTAQAAPSRTVSIITPTGITNAAIPN